MSRKEQNKLTEKILDVGIKPGTLGLWDLLYYTLMPS